MEELYKRYSRLIYNYLHSLTQNEVVSEELTQETFYRAIKKINSFRGDCKIDVWLCQIAKNLWKNYVARDKKIKVVSIEDDDYITRLVLNTEQEIEARYEIIDLYKKIHGLDEKTKEVFYLRMKGELSFKEIRRNFGKK